MIVGAELVDTTLQVQIALPEVGADLEDNVLVGDTASTDGGLDVLPAWLDPFNNQAGLLTISLNTQPLVNGLIEGVTAVLPALTGLAANTNPAFNSLSSVPGFSGFPGIPGATTLTPVLPTAETAQGGDSAAGNGANTNGSPFTSTVSNGKSAVSLNTATNTPAAFTSPTAVEPPPTAGSLLSADGSASRAGAPGGLNTALGTQVNPAGLTQAESNHDALNAARLSRGLNAAVNQQGGNITLRLTPPEMGTVRIQLNMQGGNISAQFHAETESARTLLSQQLGQLRTSLESQGLNVERLGVQAMNNSANSSSLQQQQNGQSQNQAEADGRSRGGQQQQPGGSSSNSDSDAQEERARGNLAAARDLFTDLLETPEPPEAE
ncbi:MAG: flagellar hook-length control protein FliK [Planctomycetota bacterium]